MIFDLYRHAFRGLSRRLWLLSMVTLVYRSGTMVLPFLSLYLTQDFGMTPRQAGSILALYGIGAIVGSVLGGMLSDRIGPWRAQLATLLCAAVGFFALGRCTSTISLVVVILLVSIAAEGYRPPNGAAIAAESNPENRFRAFGLRRLAINIGMTVGPACGGFLAVISYSWLFVANGMACLFAAATLWLLVPEIGEQTSDSEAAAVEKDHNTPATPLSPWHDRPFLLLILVATVLSTVFFQLMSTYPLSLRRDLGFAEPSIGMFFAVNTLVIVVAEMVLIQLVSSLRATRVIACGALLICLGLGALPLASSSLALLLISIVVWTTGEMLAFPMIEGLIAERANATHRGRYMGLWAGSFSVAFIAAPLLGTWLYDSFGFTATWLVFGSLGLVLSPAFLSLGASLCPDRQDRGTTAES